MPLGTLTPGSAGEPGTARRGVGVAMTDAARAKVVNVESMVRDGGGNNTDDDSTRAL